MHFFIIGAQRSGTTYLYQILDEHPQIQMARPARPEPKYFLEYNALRNGYDHYFEKYFEEDENTQWFGEKSTSYYEYIDAGKRIEAFFERPKILMILRDPVDRAISNYYFSLKHNVDKRSPQEVFIEKKAFQLEHPERFSTDPLAYLDRGEYIRFIKPYADLFPAQDLKILFFEELIDNEAQIQNLYRWFNVNPEFKSSLLSEKVNALEGEYPPIDEYVTEALKRHYKPFNDELRKYLNQELSFWKS
ncbi:MAG: sulfotransferase [Chitinophagales bacterium]|nr:sulfotransferase [Chitinophagales bacterium]